jgi:hypothetical protein
MITLLAHHLELRHVPVVLAIMAAGFWIGLEIASRLGRRKPRS